jgi:hypothetical protein
MRKINEWLATTPFKEFDIEVASADASFRRYFRLRKEKQTLILMDASLEKESLAPFIDVTERLVAVGVHAPRILERDLDAGLLILEDLGHLQLLDLLQESNYLQFYSLALEEILKMQQAEASGLPLYDKAFLTFEMELMQEWFLEQYVDLELSVAERATIEASLDLISTEVLRQPQGYFVHRDFHSRNIMVRDDGLLGVIDYQDAMRGALTYDLVSLLRDLYIELPKPMVEQLVLAFRDITAPDVDDATFMRWFDFMGLQRHIKVLGIFARLYLRDGKDGYLKDLPLTLKYTLETLAKYEETKALHTLLQRVELP